MFNNIFYKISIAEVPIQIVSAHTNSFSIPRSAAYSAEVMFACSELRSNIKSGKRGKVCHSSQFVSIVLNFIYYVFGN